MAVLLGSGGSLALFQVVMGNGKFGVGGGVQFQNQAAGQLHENLPNAVFRHLRHLMW
ncbi:hypothetical protein D3C78_1953800 [compost metagenome]